MAKRTPMRKEAVMTKWKRKTEATKERRIESEVEKFVAKLSACCKAHQHELPEKGMRTFITSVDKSPPMTCSTTTAHAIHPKPAKKSPANPLTGFKLPMKPGCPSNISEVPHHTPNAALNASWFDSR
jgi:hypothetical protein